MKIFVALLVTGLLSTAAVIAAERSDQAIDYLTFSQGALPIAVDGAGAGIGTGYEQALKAIDGNVGGFTLTRKFATPDADFIFTYALPMQTQFTAFEIPNVMETPSPSQTFIKTVEIYGSNTGPADGFELLAKTQLKVHEEKNQTTSITVSQAKPVRWIRLRLSSGLDVQRDNMFFEFSEIRGFGEQQPVPRSDAFTGVWKGRGVLIELKQQGAVVSGCYDRKGELAGTVSGNMLHATGKNLDSGVASAFILSVSPEGEMRGVRSTNGAPFKLYNSDTAPANTRTHCSQKATDLPSCGSVLHGIRFDYDSAQLRPEAVPVLEALRDGLKQVQQEQIDIQGHTSGEGSANYNLELSQRRSQSVVDWLTDAGIDARQLRASGMGEAQPIAKNDDEAGRSMNRRVEVHCSPDEQAKP